MQEAEQRKLWEEICEIGRRLWQRGLVAANDGNISVRLDDTRILCTPAGKCKGFLSEKDWVITDLTGQKLAGNPEPSSELKMHLAVYEQCPEIRAVVHAHPPHATAFSTAGVTLPSEVMPEIDVLLGRVPLLEYQLPGTHQLAAGVGRAAALKHQVVLLANHGATSWGSDLEQAWLRMESLDQCCHILLNARALGHWRAIPARIKDPTEHLL